MAELDIICHQHRHLFPVSLFQPGVLVDIDYIHFHSEFCLQRLERFEQFVAEVAPGAAIDGQPRRLTCHPRPEW